MLCLSHPFVGSGSKGRIERTAEGLAEQPGLERRPGGQGRAVEHYVVQSSEHAVSLTDAVSGLALWPWPHRSVVPAVGCLLI